MLKKDTSTHQHNTLIINSLQHGQKKKGPGNAHLKNDLS